MGALNLVKQCDEYGCTIACLAMITNTSYFQVRETLHRNIERMRGEIVGGVDIGLKYPEMKSTLIDIYGISCRFIKFVSIQSLNNPCILGLCDLRGSVLTCSHSVVFDAHTKQILDPYNGTIDLSQYNVFCCLEIEL